MDRFGRETRWSLMTSWICWASIKAGTRPGPDWSRVTPAEDPSHAWPARVSTTTAPPQQLLLTSPSLCPALFVMSFWIRFLHLGCIWNEFPKLHNKASWRLLLHFAIICTLLGLMANNSCITHLKQPHPCPVTAELPQTFSSSITPWSCPHSRCLECCRRSLDWRLPWISWTWNSNEGRLWHNSPGDVVWGQCVTGELI